MRNRLLPEGKRRAAALVLILSFLVLLTGMIIAFLSRTINNRQLSNSSFNTALADELARASLNVVIGDLKQEIAAGSTAYPSGSTTVYVPTDAANMLPGRNAPISIADPKDPIPNLVRTSSNKDIFFSSDPTKTVPLHQASLISSTAPSSNGRFITPRSWNSHYFIPRASTVANTASSDTTPIDKFIPPSWVYVTNQGVPLKQDAATLLGANSAPLGRYAYAIYDEGGLLDANVTGSPSGLTKIQLGRKGTPALVDLTRLNSGGTSFAQSKVDNLVGWRNYASAQPTGTFAGFTFNASSASRYFDFIIAPTNSYLSTSNVAYQGRTDQALLGRQQLIKLVHDLGPNDPPDLLQYLGTFTREQNAPSWQPAYNASERGGSDGSDGSGGTYGYRKDAEKPAQSNRDLANVRFTADSTVTRYALDGTSSTRNVRAGDLLLQQRFPIGRLNWLTFDGPNGTIQNVAAAIKKHFGLVWVSATSTAPARWVYTSPEGTLAAASSIKTLAEISALNREPDFMELLKATILRGSLGKTAGDPNSATTDTDYRTADVDASEDLQVIRIAANIIDQYDADSWSTSIEFTTPTATVITHGVENLPYVNRMFDTAYRPNDGSTRSTFGCWYEFEIWNPHQKSLQNTVAGPTMFRILGTSDPHPPPSPGDGAVATFDSGPVATPPRTPNKRYRADSFRDYSKDPPFITFNARDFSEPTLLDTTNATCDTPPKSIGTADTSTLCGLFTGKIDITGIPDSDLSGGSGGSFPQTFPNYDLQYKDAQGTWVTYLHMAHQFKSNRSGCGPVNNYYKGFSPNRGYFYRTDPRNIRFGGGKSNSVAPGATFRGVDTSPYAGHFEGKSMSDPPISAPGWTLLANGSIRMPALMNNDAGASSSYTDPDGVRRIGDSGLRIAAPGASDSAVNCYAVGNATPRPIILDRPFRSVAELGYAFRDQPWKTLDFFSANSADSALLDVFSMDDNRLDAGKVSLNTRQPLVLQAVISNAIRNEIDSTQISSDAVTVIAKDLTASTSLKPFMSRADLVTSFSTTTFDSVNYPQFKTQREAVARALTDASTTRTWNLCIDVFAQTGRFPAGVKNLASFVVEGERHCWLHVAIDRFTGEVIDQNLETIYE